MTLRMTLEVVPFGFEDQKYEILHVDVNNTGLLKNLGFGHEICSYEYFVKKPIPFVLRKEDGPSHDIEIEGKIKEHDRRDGALSLIDKVLADLKKKKYV